MEKEIERLKIENNLLRKLVESSQVASPQLKAVELRKMDKKLLSAKKRIVKFVKGYGEQTGGLLRNRLRSVDSTIYDQALEELLKEGVIKERSEVNSKGLVVFYYDIAQ